MANEKFPQPSENILLITWQTVRFMDDGAPAHLNEDLKNFLGSHNTQRSTIWNGPVVWARRSPDRTLASILGPSEGHSLLENSQHLRQASALHRRGWKNGRTMQSWSKITHKWSPQTQWFSFRPWCALATPEFARGFRLHLVFKESPRKYPGLERLVEVACHAILPKPEIIRPGSMGVKHSVVSRAVCFVGRTC